MTSIKLAAAVLNQTPLAWDANRANIVAAIRAARDRGVAILCLPELCVTGYGCEDAFLSEDLTRTAAETLLDIVPESRGLVVSLGLPVRYDGVLYNAAVLAVDGQLVGLVGKQHLAGEGVHYEPRWFRPWPAGAREEIQLGGRSYPLGDFTFDCGGVCLGFEICEDAWVADRTGRSLARRGVDIVSFSIDSSMFFCVLGSTVGLCIILMSSVSDGAPNTRPPVSIAPVRIRIAHSTTEKIPDE